MRNKAVAIVLCIVVGAGIVLAGVVTVGASMVATMFGSERPGQEQNNPCLNPMVSGSYANPLVGNITSDFGSRPNPFGAGNVPPQYPNEEYLTHHTGVDIAGVPEGTPFHAASNGTVTGVNVGGSQGGNRVTIDAGGGYEFIYGHAVDGSTLVQVGQQVTAGQPLAGTGNTGGSTGVHLHFEIRKDGTAINPTEYMSQQEITLGQGEPQVELTSHTSPSATQPPTEQGDTGQLTVTSPGGSTMTLDSAQQDTAQTIIGVGRDLGVSDNGITIALMTALQESVLYNYANESVPPSLSHSHDKVGSDHDSVNTFQQRPASGWGTIAELMDPAYAAKAFYGGPTGPNQGSPRGLLDIPGWEGIPRGEAAQTVQISAFPDAYDKWHTTATEILSRTEGITPVQCITPTSSETGTPGQNDQLEIPPTATREALITAAKKGIGGRYIWGGNSFKAWDCSGYVQWIHQQVDINLPRINQWTAGTQTSAPRPGDLVAQLWDEGSQRWTHVGIYAGNGMMYSARNPTAGTTLHPVDWNGESVYFDILGD